MKLEEIVSEPSSWRRIFIKQEAIDGPKYLDPHFVKHGYDRTPQQMTLYLCPLDQTSAKKTQEMGRIYQFEARRRKFDLTIKFTDEVRIWKRVEKLGDSKARQHTGCCLLFVLPKKGQEPASRTWELFDILRRHRIPFRRAYADDDLSVSAADQLPSILMAAGGRPYRVSLEHAGRPLWTVGLDLGHQPADGFSWLVLTLVDPHGALSKAWKCRQELNEGVEQKKLEKLLVACR